nr:hypothetical protein [Ktedonobacterales bacterium]
MAETIPQSEAATHAPEGDFVLELLAELRRGQYRPIGWGRFFARSWRQSWAAARAQPALVVSWASVTAALALAEAATLDLESRLGSREAAPRALPGALAGVAIAGFDSFVHLSMNARARGIPPHTTLG